MSGEATILHADLDAFFASVEQRDDPRLRSRPVIVGGGVVMAASYEARACGVRSAMGGTRARRLCPEAIVVPPRWEAYVEASKAVFAIFELTAPIVERLSIDEAFLDVRGLQRISGSPPQIARRLRSDVREQVGLPISVGVATTKILAKVASGAAKPDGLLVVEPGEELAFLHPLPVGRLSGVGPKTAEKLQARGIRSVGDLAHAGEPAVIAILGRAAGRRLYAVAHNRELRPVRTGRRRRSFGSQRGAGLSEISPEEIDGVLAALVDRVTRRMRRAGQSAQTVVLRLRFDDYTRATRTRTLPRPTATTATVLATARALLVAAEPVIGGRGLTLIGVTVASLEHDGATQLSLPLDGPDNAALDRALDEVRERFGAQAITRATLVNDDPALQPWLMPGEVARARPGPRPRPPRVA
ncbi:MAG: DNA polymerase IV [Actinomycetota bacterium]|nr:DNA polymerase IV [Actinomycetota bacterium]